MDWATRIALEELGVDERLIERAQVRAERLRRRYEGVDGAELYVPLTEAYTAWQWLGEKPGYTRRIKELLSE